MNLCRAEQLLSAEDVQFATLAIKFATCEVVNAFFADCELGSAPFCFSTPWVRQTSQPENKKGSECSEPFFEILILAVTYVPAPFPAQYHRPCEA
jgi:hypothetical protein